MSEDDTLSGGEIDLLAEEKSKIDPKVSKRLEELLKDKKLPGIMLGSDTRLLPHFRTTGVAQLDEIMGGGVPVNKFVMVFGESSHGKSLLCQIISASYQKQGLISALVDAEQSYDPRWWAATGNDPNQLVVMQPDYGEEAVMKTESLIGKVELITVDSLAAMIPLVEAEVDLEKKATMGRHAQLISAFYRKTLTKMRESGTSILTINQVRDNFANPYVVNLPGGRAQRFASHVMLEVSRSEWIKNSMNEKTGFVMRVRVEKNKMGLPHRSIELPFSFEGRFDFVTLVVSDAIDRGTIMNSGAYYRLPGHLPFENIDEENVKRYKVLEDTGEHQVMGRDSVHRLLEDNEQALRILELEVYGS